ncbi:MAG: ABC transporter substrate-binding protein [Flavobacteriales bacterium]|nr:ABC transporter substrate-binding protein [Flavobacteriales bacterium]
MKNFIHIGGVPEHYNYPWQAAIEQGRFAEKEIDVRWSDFAGGTGSMCKALQSGDLDMAVLLPEGIIADIMHGGTSRIVQSYVVSPLLWGVHVSARSPLNDVLQLKSPKFAISRINSGSHLMSHLLAERQGFHLADDSFTLVNDLAGARQALQQNPQLLFLWEKYTAKPLVDSGEFKRIGEIYTPWPSFVIAASEEMITHYGAHIQCVLDIINDMCRKLMKSPNTESQIAVRYGLNMPDTFEWFESVKWNTGAGVSTEALLQVCYFLHKRGIISHIPDGEMLTAHMGEVCA